MLADLNAISHCRIRSPTPDHNPDQTRQWTAACSSLHRFCSHDGAAACIFYQRQKTSVAASHSCRGLCRGRRQEAYAAGIGVRAVPCRQKSMLAVAQTALWQLTLGEHENGSSLAAHISQVRFADTIKPVKDRMTGMISAAQ